MDTPSLDRSRYAALRSARRGNSTGIEAPASRSHARPISTICLRTRPSEWLQRAYSRPAQSAPAGRYTGSGGAIRRSGRVHNVSSQCADNGFIQTARPTPGRVFPGGWPEVGRGQQDHPAAR